MLRWLIIFVVLAAALIAGITYSVRYATRMGKDRVVFADGTELYCAITRYEHGTFYYKKESDLSSQAIRPGTVRRIDFAGSDSDDLRKHRVTSASGKTVPCRVVRYRDGTLWLKDPGGRERQGPLTEIAEIQFNR